jgi:hypothetical protein
MILERFDVGSWPPFQRPSWFNLVTTRAISGGCQAADEAQAWEEEVKKCINEDPHAVCTPQIHIPTTCDSILCSGEYMAAMETKYDE